MKKVTSKNTIARQVKNRFFSVYCTFESLENLKEKKKQVKTFCYIYHTRGNLDK